MKKLLRKRNKGFTLIELMIVVAIIGILAAIAIPNFLRFQLKAKSSEGKVNIAAIRVAENSYYGEYVTFVGAAASPAAAGVGQKQPFVDTELATVGAGFNVLGWEPEGDIYFSYAAVVQNAVGTPSHNFTISAAADIDGDTAQQFWGFVHAGAGASAIAGSHAACEATGVWDGAAATKSALDQVGACDDVSANSVF
jgi:type IV pilus assembly protein PilA